MNQDNSEETFDFTDLGEKLRGPDGGEVATASTARLARLSEAVAARLAGGLPPGEYERHLALSQALAAAQSVMVRISSIITVGSGGASGSAPAKKGE